MNSASPYLEHPEKKLTLYFFVLGFTALLIGVLFGPLQALNYANIDLYPYLEPVIGSYYQGLSLHGVLNAIVFPQLIAMGLLLYLPARELKLRPNMTLGWVSWWVALGGLVVAAIPLLLDQATVLYTFYPPLKASWAFYLGAGVFVLSSWFTVYLVWDLWRRWKKQNPAQPTPLVTFMSLITWVLWFLASLGLAAEALVFLIPWSLGIAWQNGLDPLVARTLFWFTGHPIVYFWLMPAYVAIYGLLPKQAGGKLISDPLARVVFLLLLLFSTPVGFHHQFADPGIDPAWKMIHTVLTMMVAVPSLITAFTIGASLELAGRMRGGRGILGWIPALPWRDPSVAAMLLGLIAFIFGGAGGIVNASFTLDLVIHNTAWIPGHFHLQVATLVTMTHMGVAFWLIPHLTGKPLVRPNVALASVILWFTGMMTMGIGMHWMGLLGVPRRTYIAGMAQPDAYATSAGPMALNAISGIILFLAAILFYYVFFATLTQRQRVTQETPIPFTDFVSGPSNNGVVALTERVGMWFGLAVALVVVAYGPSLAMMLVNFNPAPGWKLW